MLLPFFSLLGGDYPVTVPLIFFSRGKKIVSSVFRPTAGERVVGMMVV